MSITSAPWAVRSTDIPGSTKSVEPSSSTTAGPASVSPGCERRAVHDLRVQPAVAADVDLALGARRPGPRRSRARGRAAARLPIAVTLKLTSSITSPLDRVAVALGVQLVEAAERALERRLVELAALDLDLVLVVLAEVAHVDRAPDLRLAREALLPELARARAR